jgi:hypothetical protein
MSSPCRSTGYPQTPGVGEHDNASSRRDWRTLSAVSDSADDEFQAKLKSVGESQAHARQYLERTERHVPDQWHLPRAIWMKTGGPLAMAEPGELTCGDKAVQEVEFGMTYAPPAVTRDVVRCARVRGHEGSHACKVKASGLRKSHWQALSWSSSDPAVVPAR